MRKATENGLRYRMVSPDFFFGNLIQDIKCIFVENFRNSINGKQSKMDNPSLEQRLNSVKKLTIVDKVEIKLRHFFTNENLQPGDAIPKEVELAKAMGVSRTAIREALIRLKLLGLIDSKKIGA